MSKYEPLWNYVMQHEPGQFSLTFDEIEDVLGFQIDHSFLKYKKELAERGAEVLRISLKNKTVHSCCRNEELRVQALRIRAAEFNR